MILLILLIHGMYLIPYVGISFDAILLLVAYSSMMIYDYH